MRTTYLLFFFFCVFSLKAQIYTPFQISTPNGMPVEVEILSSPDLTQNQKNELKNYWLRIYNNRISFIDEATNKYNCHAYAWYLSEEGYLQAWMNTPEDDKYWNDISYVEVSLQTQASKVSFGGPCLVWVESLQRFIDKCDHSAITTNTPDYFISKWGNSPRFAHDKNDCPYSLQDLHYYTRLTISGANYVCKNTNFTLYLPPMIQPFTVSWTYSSNITLVSLSGNQATFRANNDTYTWVKANVTINGQSAEVTKEINIDSPPYSTFSYHVNKSTGEYIPPSSTLYYDVLCPNTAYHIRLDCSQNIYLTNYQWSIPAAWTRFYAYDNMISINTNSVPGGQVSVTATTPCGVTKTVYSAYFGSASDCGGRGMPSSDLLRVYPNPASDMVTIALQEEQLSETNRLATGQRTPVGGNPFIIQVWNNVGKVKEFTANHSIYQFSVTDLAKGLYFVRVIKNGKTYTQKLLIE